MVTLTDLLTEQPSDRANIVQSAFLKVGNRRQRFAIGPKTRGIRVFVFIFAKNNPKP